MKMMALVSLGVLVAAVLAGCGEKPEHNANWYYYWEKDDVIPGLDRNGSPKSRWDWSATAANEQVYGAAHGPTDGYVLTDYCIQNPVQSPIRVYHRDNPQQIFHDIGAATQFGVECAAATTAHEKQHIANWRKIRDGAEDSDRDGLADDEEGVAPYWFVVGYRDTYDIAAMINPHYATYGDNEFVARQAEQGGVATARLDQDWSCGGAQWRR